MRDRRILYRALHGKTHFDASGGAPAAGGGEAYQPVTGKGLAGSGGGAPATLARGKERGFGQRKKAVGSPKRHHGRPSVTSDSDVSKFARERGRRFFLEKTEDRGGGPGETLSPSKYGKGEPNVK